MQGDYVDFSKLLPYNKVSIEDDHRMEMVNYGGQTFWVPASDKNQISISNFSKWEQAFRVFSNIYTQQHQGRASELIQYNHIIHTAFLTFAWDNVYQYDKEFRLHLSRHPEHSWSVILQQAWTMYLKDRVSNTSAQNNGSANSPGGGRGAKSKKICFDFNSGYCSYGSRCKFDHRCGVCGKYGHGTYNCRKVAKQNGDNNYNSNFGHFSDYRDQGEHGDGTWE